MQLKENDQKPQSLTEKKEYKNFICLGVVVNSQGEVLMIRRAREEVGEGGQKLTWAFPGGKLIEGENREQCVEREVLAETGYEILSI